MKKTNIMKILSLVFAVLILASSAMAIRMDDYPEVFKNADGDINVDIVVGDKAPADDVVGAVDIGASLQYYIGGGQEGSCGLSIDGDVVWIEPGDKESVNGVPIEIIDTKIYPGGQDMCKVDINNGATVLWMTQGKKLTKTINGVEHELEVVDVSDIIRVGSSKLASQVMGSIEDLNIISVGNPCVNDVTEEILDAIDEPISCTMGLGPGESVIRTIEKWGNVYVLLYGYDRVDTRRASRVLANYQKYRSSFDCDDITYIYGTTLTDIKISCEPFVDLPPVSIELFTGSEAIVSADGLKHEITLVDTSDSGDTCGLDVDGDVVWLEATNEEKIINRLAVKVHEAGIDRCLITARGELISVTHLEQAVVSPVDEEIDLSEYPNFFLQNGEFIGVIVVGEKAPAEDVVSAVDIGASIQFYLGTSQDSSCGLSIDGDVVWIKSSESKTVNGVKVKVYESRMIKSYPQDQDECRISIAGDNTFWLTQENVFTKNVNGVDHEIKVVDVSGASLSSMSIGSAQLSSEVSDIKQVHAIVVGNPITNPKVKELYPDFYNDVKPGEAVIRLFHNNGKFQLVVGGYGAASTRKAARILSKWDSYDLDGKSYFIETGVDDEDLPTVSPISVGGQPPQPITTVEENVTVTPPQPVCDSGCSRNDSCLPFGTRLINGIDDNTPKFCSINKEFQLQKKEGDTCQNNYECVSNQCSNGKCVDLEKQIRENRVQIEQQASTLQKILDWLKNLF
ncbi:hypothetical protein ACFL0W_03100 [Nanoarchaeota archaeon]